MAQGLNTLAALYGAQGRHDDAESLYQRALAIYEMALGPDHPQTAKTLENYAALLRNARRATEAEKLEARAKVIRSKQRKSES